MMSKKIVCISRSGNYEIVVCKDSHNGVAVQVVMLVDKLQPTGLDNKLSNIRTRQVIKQYLVPSGDNFKQSVNEVISQAKGFLAHIKKGEASIDGLLNDLHSANKELNKDGTV